MLEEPTLQDPHKTNRDESRLQREPDRSLVFVIPPRSIDVTSMSGYVFGHFLMYCGLALIAPYIRGWDVTARIGTAALGLLSGYMHGYAVVHNYTVPLRFVFRSQDEVLVTTAGGKKIRRSSVAESRIGLQRKGRSGPGRFEWSHGLAEASADLCESDFDTLAKYNLRVSATDPAPLQRTFTRDDRRAWWMWAAVWSLPWWGVLYRSIFPDR
jgi:hypothetical protein